MFAVSSRIGQCIHVHGLQDPTAVTPNLHPHLHLMAGRGGNLGFITAVYDLCRLSCLHCDNSRINLCHHGLLGTKAAPNPGLDDPDPGLRHIQRMGKYPPCVERNLGGRHDVQPSIYIHVGVSAECLHHGLLVGLGVVNPLNHMAASGKSRVQVPMGLGSGSTQVAEVVRAHAAKALPAFLRVHQDMAVLGIVHIKHRLQHLVFNTYQAHGMVHCRLIHASHNGNRVPHEPEALVQDQPVIRAWLRICLPRHGKPLLRHVFICKDALNARGFSRHRTIYLCNQGMGVRASEHLHNQAVL